MIVRPLVQIDLEGVPLPVVTRSVPKSSTKQARPSPGIPIIAAAHRRGRVANVRTWRDREDMAQPRAGVPGAVDERRRMSLADGVFAPPRDFD